MASTNYLPAEERAALLEDLQDLRSDADQIKPSQLLERFLPLPSHDRALRRDVMVVRGERGAGKSMLFQTLKALKKEQQPLVRLFPRGEDDGQSWVEGFSESGTSHPTTELVAKFMGKATTERARVMWVGHLVGCLSEAMPEVAAVPAAFKEVWHDRNDIERWVAVADANLAPLTSWLDRVHEKLLSNHQEVVVLYDHLDKIGTTSPREREKATSSLLALWLSLSNRYRALRAKIFVREDLFEASLSGSADASKLRSRSVSLGWDVASLYRMLIRQMAAQSPEMRSWIEDTQNRVPLESRAGLGWFPPDPLREHGKPSQEAFVEHLAGKQMGRGVKKGFVYRWIPDRLQDARGAIAPRSMINLIAYAAERARPSPKAMYKRLLHPLELQAALELTSKQRVDELAEEHVVVYRLDALDGLIVPVERPKLVERLARATKREDGFGDDGEAVVEELERIGVLRPRENGRWDVPDIYRYGYGIKRKGGVARPK